MRLRDGKKAGTLLLAVLLLTGWGAVEKCHKCVPRQKKATIAQLPL